MTHARPNAIWWGSSEFGLPGAERTRPPSFHIASSTNQMDDAPVFPAIGCVSTFILRCSHRRSISRVSSQVLPGEIGHTTRGWIPAVLQIDMTDGTSRGALVVVTAMLKWSIFITVSSNDMLFQSKSCIRDTTNKQEVVSHIPQESHSYPGPKTEPKRHLYIKPSKIPITQTPIAYTPNPPIPSSLKSLTQTSIQAQSTFHSPHQRA
jgi:hypothetical protein